MILCAQYSCRRNTIPFANNLDDVLEYDTNYAMSRKERGFKMEIGNVGSILATALFFLNLPVALARAPDKITFGSGGRIEDFACVDVGRCNNGRVGISLSEEA